MAMELQFNVNFECHTESRQAANSSKLPNCTHPEYPLVLAFYGRQHFALRTVSRIFLLSLRLLSPMFQSSSAKHITINLASTSDQAQWKRKGCSQVYWLHHTEVQRSAGGPLQLPKTLPIRPCLACKSARKWAILTLIFLFFLWA